MDISRFLEFYGNDIWIAIFVYGLLIGSFLNVLIYRLPIQILEKEMDKNSERFGFNKLINRSMCPHCSKKIPWYYNMPVFAWLWLKGVSSCCNNKISGRYPIIEFIGGVIPLVVGYFHGLTILTLLLSIAMWALLALFIIDFKHFLLPDILVFTVFASGGVASYMGLLEHSFILSLVSSIATMVIMKVGGDLYSKCRGLNTLGFGDVKLMGAFVIWLGPLGAPLVFMFSALGLPMLLMDDNFERDDDVPKNAIPYGPLLIIGFVATLLFGGIVIN